MIFEIGIFVIFFAAVNCVDDTQTDFSYNLYGNFRDDFRFDKLDETQWIQSPEKDVENNKPEIEKQTSDDGYETILDNNGKSYNRSTGSDIEADDRTEKLLQCSMKINVENGFLNFTVDKFSIGKFKCNGRVRRREKFDFLYGEVEFRVRTPQENGAQSTVELETSQTCNEHIKTNDHAQWCPSTILIISNGNDQAQGSRIGFCEDKYKWIGCEESQKTMIKSPLFHVYKLVWLPNELSWYADGKKIRSITEQHRIPSVPMNVMMDFTVTGTNHQRFSEFLIDYIIINPRQEVSKSFNWLPVVISLTCILASLILIASPVYYFYWRKRRQQASLNIWTSQGDDSDHDNLELNPLFRFLEVQNDQLELTAESLGKGQYGSVWKGLLKKKNGSDERDSSTVVAVKTPLGHHNDCEADEQRQLFIEEMKIMIKVGRHLNIVNLLGTVTVRNPAMMVLEFCSHGSLLNYLRKKTGFINSVDKEGLLMNNGNVVYVNLGLTGNDYLNQAVISATPDSQLSTDDLILISYQISRGLEYLASRSIIHRDLAARNVLVCDDNLVKISDFGLARERFLSDYTLHNDQVLLPVKWMAPESLLEKSYSHKSDIWTFGILLWEIFSLGQEPFSSADGKKFAGDIVDFIHAVSARGLRLQRPVYSPAFMYDIMLRCWNIDKDARPTASVFRTELSNHLKKESTNYYLHLDEPYQEYNLVYAALFENSSKTETSTDARSLDDPEASC